MMSKLGPVSTSVVSDAPGDTTLSVKDGTKRRKRNLSVTNRSDGMTTGRNFPSEADHFSSSLDEESGLEVRTTSSTTNRTISADVDNKMPPEPSSSQPPSDNSTNKSGKKAERDMTSTPKIKLKPRPPRRSGAAFSSTTNAGRSRMPSSINMTPPPKILIPFLSSRSTYPSLEVQEKRPKQSGPKPLQSPPLIKRFSMQSPSVPNTPVGSKIRRVMSDPIPLYLKKKTKWARSVSTPLLSPPQLAPWFDFGISSPTGIDAITPPPAPLHPPALLTTPPSATMVSQAPLPMNSGEAMLHKYDGRERVFVPTMAKPIARRPVITPSTRINKEKDKDKNNHHHETSGSSVSSIGIFSGVDDYTPRRIFPSSSIGSNLNSGAAAGGAVSLSSSMEYSAFSSSSIVPISSSRSTTIRRTLSADDDD